jgi:hypothetical protein
VHRDDRKLHWPYGLLVSGQNGLVLALLYAAAKAKCKHSMMIGA